MSPPGGGDPAAEHRYKGEHAGRVHAGRPIGPWAYARPDSGTAEQVAKLLNAISWAGAQGARLVVQRAAVTGDAGPCPELAGHALRGFENGMDVVLLQELGTAEAQDARVKASARRSPARSRAWSSMTAAVTP
jgi:hypothetical protein